MKAAITGATGFVGRHLVATLRAKGDEVACLTRGNRTASAPLDGCRWVAGDLEDAAALKELVRGAEVVYHVAGVVAAVSKDEYWRVNGEGTRAVAAAARQASVRRLIHVSSLAVTGPAARGTRVDESTPPSPVTLYGQSKLGGEVEVLSSGVPFTIVRPAAVYGPGDREFLRLFRMARLGMVSLVGDGKQELCLIHAADLATALRAAADAPAAEGRVYHAAHPEVVTQRELLETIGHAVGRRVRIVGVPPPVVRLFLGLSGALARVAGRTTLLTPHKAPELLAPAWTCATEALTRDAGWRALIPLRRGLPETAAWYWEHGWL